MNPDLLTQLVRAGNDGVIPRPLAGEDMDVYKFRAACAGAIVAAAWMEARMKAHAEQEAAAREDELSGAAMGGGRPDDVPVTSPGGALDKTAQEIDNILRRPHLNGAGTRDFQDAHPDEIGVD